MALDFGGTNEHLTVPSDSTLDVSDLTLSAWVWWDASDVHRPLASRADTGTASNGWWWAITDQDRLSLSFNDSDFYTNFDALNNLHGAWHHLCAVLNTAAQEVRLYGDGSALSGSPVATSGATITNYAGTLYIAREVNAYTSTAYLDGKMAELALWSAALTPDEVSILANGYSPLHVRAASLGEYWRILRNDPVLGLINGNNATHVNTPAVYPHPRVIYPAPPVFWSVPAAGGTQYNQSALGSLGPVGVISKLTGIAKTGSVTSAGIAAKLTSKAFSGSLTSVGVLGAVKTALRSLTGSLTASGSLSRQTGKPFTGSITTAGTTNKQTGKAFIGSITSAGTIATVKAALKSIGGSIAAAGSLTKQAAKSFTGSAATSGALVKQTIKAFTGTLTPAGILATTKTALLSITGSLTASGVLSRMTNKPATGSLTASGGITKRIAKSITGVLTTVGTLVRAIVGLPTPDSRKFAINSEDRRFAINGEDRRFAINSEDRRFAINS